VKFVEILKFACNKSEGSFKYSKEYKNSCKQEGEKSVDS